MISLLKLLQVLGTIYTLWIGQSSFKSFRFYCGQSIRGLGLNIGNGKPTTVLDLLETFEKVYKLNISYRFVSRREGDAGIIYTKKTYLRNC